nr:hypothetical protein [Tanacetum cinerariifolium]
MKELVVKYKAEKVCHGEIVKMALVDLKVLEDGSFRICIDYRELSKIDLYSSCHQIRVHEDEIPKTAFRMCYGRYEFTAMSFWVNQCTSDFHGRNESGVLAVFREKVIAYMTRQLKIHVENDTTHVMDLGVVVLPYNAREGLNMRQRQWMELFSDYGCETKYHMGKVNIVVDAWRRKRGVKPRRVRDIYTMAIQEDYKMEMLESDVEVVRNASSYEACVRNLVVVGILTFCEAEIGESKMIVLELEQETTKVVVIKERLKEAKDRHES